MIELFNSKDKAYCSCCDKRLPGKLTTVDIGNDLKSTQIGGLCDDCLLELMNKIKERLENNE